MPRVLAANAWFKGTAIAVLDESLQLLTWTWLLSSPALQVSRSPVQVRQGYHAPLGAAGNFTPPWSLRSYDTRLFNFDGRHVFATALEPCEHSPKHRCAGQGQAEFGVQLLQLTAEATASGGATALRAWLTARASSSARWMQGRNQALFRAPATAWQAAAGGAAAGGAADGAGPPRLMAQPWLGLVASLGAPSFRNETVRCHHRSSYAARRQQLAECATTPRDATATVHKVRGLTAAALETLAIVAYKQPVSRAQVSAIRGVDVDGVIRTLQQRGFIDEVSRDSGPGNAVLFGTTREFLERMGLDGVEQLPPLGDFVPGPEVVEALERGLRSDPDSAAAEVLDDGPPAAASEASGPVAPEG